jgi:hypothetical protein
VRQREAAREGGGGAKKSQNTCIFQRRRASDFTRCAYSEISSGASLLVSPRLAPSLPGDVCRRRPHGPRKVRRIMMHPRYLLGIFMVATRALTLPPKRVGRNVRSRTLVRSLLLLPRQIASARCNFALAQHQSMRISV